MSEATAAAFTILRKHAQEPRNRMVVGTAPPDPSFTSGDSALALWVRMVCTHNDTMFFASQLDLTFPKIRKTNGIYIFVELPP